MTGHWFAMIPILFQKAQNHGYTRKDGTYVKPYNDRRVAAKKPAAKPVAHPKPEQNALPIGEQPAPPSCSMLHPKQDDNGKPKRIDYPSSPSSQASWGNHEDAVVVTPGSQVPQELHGVALSPWLDHPAGDDWDFVDGQNDDLEEPPLKLVGGKKPASGVIVQEPDGRVWIISPTNQYGGVLNTFPKGGVEEGLSYQSNAIKEAYEESGLKVEIDAFALDVERTTSVSRYYLAHRVGGSPADMGWESQAVRLVPLTQLGDYLNRPEDREILRFLRDNHRVATP